jgi:MFS family permease
VASRSRGRLATAAASWVERRTGATPAALWATVVRERRTAIALAGVAVICLLPGYSGTTGGLLTVTLPYVDSAFPVDDSDLGLGLAVVRIAALLVVPLALVADVRGRRRVVMVLAPFHCTLTALVALAPSFPLYIAGNAILRASAMALQAVMAVLVVESVPARLRGLSVSFVLTFVILGSGLGVVALPVAALGETGLRATYAAALLLLPFVILAVTRLPESPRYRSPAAGRWRLHRELLPRGGYGGRVALAGGAVLLVGAMFTPATEFLTRYLARELDYRPFAVASFMVVVGLTSVAALLAAGRAGDRIGRKPVGVAAASLGGLLMGATYVSGPVLVWVFGVLGQACVAATLATLQPYASELFPTRIRAGAHAMTLALGLVGSIVGLAATGVLSRSMGLGPAIAVLAPLPLLGAALVAARLPETASLELEVTSDEDAAAEVVTAVAPRL